MYGKYQDPRVYQHFVHTYSRVPYIDHEIFNVQTNALRESRRAQRRTNTAQQGIERTQAKSEQMENKIKEGRTKREQEASEFLLNLQKSQEASLAKEKQVWSEYQKGIAEKEASNFKDQKYLQSLLKQNSTKAESRLTTVRRWS